jgi:hypothetical protein
MTKEVLKLALDALETSMYPQQKQLQAITAIKEALMSVPDGAQPSVSVEQEPVAFEKTVCPFCSSEWVTAEQHDRKVDRLERLPLTDEHKERLANAWFAKDTRLYTFARAIEAAHGIKEIPK